MKDYYSILNVKRSSTKDEIKSSYRELAKKYHPDKNPGDKVSEEKFKEISEAYETLSDPSKKRTYDNKVNDPVTYRKGPTPSRRNDMDDIFSDISFSFSGGQYEDIFNSARDIFNRKYKKRGEDITMNVIMTLEEIATGCFHKTSYERRSKCNMCNGTGEMSPSAITNQDYSTDCKTCKGLGYSIIKKEINIKIPAGVDDKSKTTVRGFGHWDKNCTGEGDLHLVIVQKPHKIFEREGDNILMSKKVSFTAAALGYDVHIPTVNRTNIKINLQKVNFGSPMRVKGKGIDGADMIVTFEVFVPKYSQISIEAVELLESLSLQASLEPDEE